MRECSKTFGDGCTLALDSYPKYHETGKFLDRLFRRKVYVLKLEKMMGAVMTGISDASTSCLMKHVYPPRKFYQNLYDRIENEQDFNNARVDMKKWIT